MNTARMSKLDCVSVSLPVPNPARVTVRALAMDGVAVVAVFAGGTHLLAVFAKEAFGAKLVTAGPVPASVTGDAASLSHLTRLLALAVPTPVVRQERQKKRILFVYTKLPPFHINTVKLFWKHDEMNT